MYGVLQTLYELLEVVHPSLERTEVILLRSDDGRLRRVLGRGCTANLADPGNHSLALADCSRA